jgi:hypothetical protein
LARIVAGQGGERTGASRRWALPLADRVLLTTVYYRTNLTFRQIALLFGISKSLPTASWTTSRHYWRSHR